MLSLKCRVLKLRFFFPEVLEGLGSSGRCVGSTSTLPGTCRSLCCRIETLKSDEDWIEQKIISVLPVFAEIQENMI